MNDARSVTLAAGGRWHGRYGSAPCPVCQPERKRSQCALSITDGDDGRLLVKCFKGNCDFRSIASALGIAQGPVKPPDPVILAQRAEERRKEAQKRADQARAIWHQTVPISGTPAETYLRRRGIACDLADTLRFHPDCWHGPTAQRLPAMVALVEGSDWFAVHRTYLRADGSGKAPVDRNKAMLGNCEGGAVRLFSGHATLAVAEGIETALSLASGLLRGPVTLWAALSTSGMRGLRLPRQHGRLGIACDGDQPGRAAAAVLADHARRCGWRVDIYDPGDDRDFNDLVCPGLSAFEGSAT